MAKAMNVERKMWSKLYTYDEWMEAQRIPIYRGYYIEDLRTLELGWWKERECNAAFIQLVGQEGVSSARVSEIPPGRTMRPLKVAFDEIVYVVEGRGLTTIWAGAERPKKTFEWQKHSMFLLPHNYTHQFSNMRGDQPARLLHYNYMPLVLSGVRDSGLLFDNPYEGLDIQNELDFYSEAKLVQQNTLDSSWGRRAYWYGNFFPDMRAWDKLDANVRRGAGGRSVYIQFPDSEMSCHMSVFDARLYKKAHRHGPGRVIVIPAGEGYSIMWEEGKEKVVVPWHEASCFVPPNRWFHQHFNAGSEPARYLALHPPMQFHGHAEKIEDRAKDQIEYVNEDPWIREKFESELGKRGLTSLMPPQVYTDANFEWNWSPFLKARAQAS
ncbi:MAG TPA: cupin domain-containing protein [Candidatus Eisenbacteria bacterium]|nr:cupin domain-containing protein [Candidatus Eisenbacteria bacterium]